MCACVVLHLVRRPGQLRPKDFEGCCGGCRENPGRERPLTARSTWSQALSLRRSSEAAKPEDLERCHRLLSAGIWKDQGGKRGKQDANRTARPLTKRAMGAFLASWVEVAFECLLLLSESHLPIDFLDDRALRGWENSLATGRRRPMQSRGQPFHAARSWETSQKAQALGFQILRSCVRDAGSILPAPGKKEYTGFLSKFVS